MAFQFLKPAADRFNASGFDEAINEALIELFESILKEVLEPGNEDKLEFASDSTGVIRVRVEQITLQATYKAEFWVEFDPRTIRYVCTHARTLRESHPGFG